MITMDRISKLPPTIIENILCLIPIQEAARTSILAKEWRYHWTGIPKLVFDEDAFQVPSVPAETLNDNQSHRTWMTKRCKLFYAIYQVMLKHDGPIDEFSLSMRTDETCVEIDHIVFYLLKNNTVKKLSLHMVGGYKLPLSFFSLDHLTDLYLHWCDFDHQPTFKGFRNLTSLFLEIVSTTRSTLFHLLTNCRLLKSLTMYIDGIEGIGDFTITNLFECIPMVESLSIWLMVMECFAENGLPRMLPVALIHLKYLFIDHMNFDYKYGLPFLFLLIRSSPNIEKIKLRIFEDPWFEPRKRSKLKGYSDLWLGRLKVIEITNLSNEKLDLDFVKVILARSPVLKKVRILLWKDIDEDDKMQITASLLSSQRASPLVEITVERNA